MAFFVKLTALPERSGGLAKDGATSLPGNKSAVEL
jgi:hypothetical protein